MTRLQKVAVWNLGVMLTSMFGAMILLLIFPQKGIVMNAMLLMLGLFFGPKIFKGKNEPDWDEMENKIGRNAELHGYTVFWVVLIITTTLLPVFKGYTYSRSFEYVAISLSFKYIAIFPLFAVYLLIIIMSLSVFYQSSLKNRFKKLLLLLVAIIILSIPAILTANIISGFSGKRYFTGSTQKDEWHFNSSKNIIAHSKIVFNNHPAGKKKVYVSLPYVNGKIQKVLFDGQELKSKDRGVAQYDIYLPDNVKTMKGKEIKVIWQFPLKNLENIGEDKNTIPYKTRIRSLIPIERIWLTGILDEGCGYETNKYPEQKKLKKVVAAYNGSSRYGVISNFGSCGFAIHKKANTETENE